MKKLVNGIEVDLTQAEIEEMQLRESKHQEYLIKKAATQYQRDRAIEYPSIADQLDIIYHSGVDAWKAQIATIKAKYPKPE